MRSMVGVAAATVVICCAGLLPRAADTAQWTVTSPDGELAFELRLGDGTGAATAAALSYTVTLGKTAVVNRSTLGVRRDDQAFVDGLTFVEASQHASVDDTYIQIHGKRRVARHHANEQRFTLSNATNGRVNVIVRVSNDGVAFRYHFPERDTREHKLVEESTGFAVPAGATAWIMPHQPVTKYRPASNRCSSRCRLAPQHRHRPAGRSLPSSRSQPGRRGFSSLSLALTRPMLRLVLRPRRSMDSIGFVCRKRARGTASERRSHHRRCHGRCPGVFLIIGDSPAAIVESTLVDELAPPSVLKDTSWISPGRSRGAGGRRATAQEGRALKSFVDLAAEMGWEFPLIDANWNHMDRRTAGSSLTPAQRRSAPSSGTTRRSP